MIENADGTPEELAKKKADAIRFRNMKRNSTIFILASTVVQIIESLAILAVLFVITLLICFRILHLEKIPSAGFILQIIFFVLFFVGLILGFFAYKHTMNFIIKKFDLSDKILESTLAHYRTETNKR